MVTRCDGVVYQAPATGFTRFRYYKPGRVLIKDPSGHLRVTITPSLATVDVATTSGAVTTLHNRGADQRRHAGNVDGNGAANSTGTLIILSCDVGLDTTDFCPMNCGDINGVWAVNSSEALVSSLRHRRISTVSVVNPAARQA